MNPSASGWIDKFGYLVKDQTNSYKDFTELYVDLKKIGFVYGVNLLIPRFITPEHKLSEDEKAKTIIIQITKNKMIKTLYKKKLKSGEELQDIEVKPYVVALIQSYVGDDD